MDRSQSNNTPETDLEGPYSIPKRYNVLLINVEEIDRI